MSEKPERFEPEEGGRIRAAVGRVFCDDEKLRPAEIAFERTEESPGGEVLVLAQALEPTERGYYVVGKRFDLEKVIGALESGTLDPDEGAPKNRQAGTTLSVPFFRAGASSSSLGRPGFFPGERPRATTSSPTNSSWSTPDVPTSFFAVKIIMVVWPSSSRAIVVQCAPRGTESSSHPRGVPGGAGGGGVARRRREGARVRRFVDVGA